MSPSTHTTVNRRRLLVGGAVATAVAAALAACGDDDTAGDTGSAGTASPSASGGGGASDVDLAVAAVAAGLEVLAVQTYAAALSAALGGKLGAVPPAVATYATTAKAHHEAHLAAWNGILKTAGKPEVAAPNATLKPTVDGMFAKVKDIAGVGNLALTLEQIAAQTYLKALPMLTSKAAIQKAGEILIVDQQHQVILLYALGKYPVPESFLSTDKAVAG